MRYMRQILAALVLLGIIVLIFVLIAKGFRSGNQSSPINQTDLVSYAKSDAVAELTIDAPVVVDQDHREVRISVSQYQTQIEILKGYQGEVIDSRTFANNSDSYAVFLQSLKNLNFAKGNTSSEVADERGYCPAGNRYIYRFADGSNNIFRFWSTSCGQGTFGGNRQDVRILFERQIPNKDFNQLTASISLG